MRSNRYNQIIVLTREYISWLAYRLRTGSDEPVLIDMQLYPTSHPRRRQTKGYNPS